MHRTLAALAALFVIVPTVAASGAGAEESECGTAWTPYTREAAFEVTTESNIPIEMSDGVTLYADLLTPVADGPFSTIVTQTGYSKGILGASDYFVQRGYAHLVVDLRGTGTSEGSWQPLSPREQQDGFEVFEWVVDQPWSDGRTAGYGASYLGLTQIFSAERQPKGLKAIFPIVPVADSYRDIVLMGGQLNAAFMPAWVGLTTGLSLSPTTRMQSDPAGAAQTIAEHLLNVGNDGHGVRMMAEAVTGSEDLVYDGEFWRDRSPITNIDQVEVPTFITGGLNDLFQRGEPMLFEALRKRVDARLLMGPWGHINGSSAAGLVDEGLPAIEDIALRWFDGHVLGLDTDLECIPSVTMWNWGPEEYVIQPDWPHPDMHPQQWYLAPDGLSREVAAAEGSGTVPPWPLSGVCSRSTNQWLMGVLDGSPCATDNSWNETTELTFTSPVLDEDLVVNGPAAAHLWLETVGTEAVVAVRVTDVSPDGTSRELTNGLQVASFREVDEDKSRIVDGMNLQPWHPYTPESVDPITSGEPYELSVEIFPTAAVIPAGHQLRVSIATADVPHAMSPLPQEVQVLTSVTSVLYGPEHPSTLVLPVVAASGRQPAGVGVDVGPSTVEAAPGSLPATGGGAVAVGLLFLVPWARRNKERP